MALKAKLSEKEQVIAAISSEPLRRINAALPESLFIQFKQKLAAEHKTIRGFLIMAVTDYLSE